MHCENHGSLGWQAKYFPMNYHTESEELSFTIQGGLGGSAAGMVAKLGLWRSHFRAEGESIDPTAWADTATNTSYLVREPDLVAATTAGNGSGADAAAVFTVTVGVNDIITLTTRTAGVPHIAPVLPHPPTPSATGGCTFPRQLVEDFDGVALGQTAKYFQDMHGAFEAVSASSYNSDDVDPAARGVVLRQMSVGQPIGFHGTDSPPLSVVGSQAAVAANSGGGVSVDVLIEGDSSLTSSVGSGSGSNNSAVLGMAINNAQCGHCGIYFQLWDSGNWAVGPSVVASTKAWKTGHCTGVGANAWHTMALNISGGSLSGSVDGVLLFGGVHSVGIDATARGWVGIGSGASWGPVQFDRFAMDLGLATAPENRT